MMHVAKTYKTWPRICDEFQENGKWYVNVRSPAGTIRKVRMYTDREYQRMYPDEVVEDMHPKAKENRTQKEILGFTNGFIWIFKGDTYQYADWFRLSIARYTRWWGWYIVSTDELPDNLPVGIQPIKLPWEAISTATGNLIPEDQIEEAVAPYLYEDSISEFQSSIGDRIELNITIIKNIKISNSFGNSIMHVMEDDNHNVYVWTTAAKDWPEGSVKRIRGTIKDHRTYRNIKQNVLSRVTEI